jgi:hypothetical protein
MKHETMMYVVGAVLSVAAMFALNRYQRPKMDTQYGAAEYTTSHGTISLNRKGASSEFSLMTTHVVALDISRFGHVYKVRELLLRGAASSAQVASIELYADVSRPSGEGGGARDPHILEREELPLLPTGRLGTRPSYVLLDGSEPRRVIAGSLMLTEIIQTEGGANPVFRAAGRVEMQIDNESGIEMITGRVEGQISWDTATGA